MNTLLVPMPDVGDTIVVQFFGLKKMGRVLHKNNDIYTIQYKHATLTDTLHFPWYYPKSSPKHVKLPLAHLKNTADAVTSGRKRTPTDFYKAEPARRQKRCGDDIALAVTAESDDDETGLTAHAAISGKQKAWRLHGGRWMVPPLVNVLARATFAHTRDAGIPY